RTPPAGRDPGHGGPRMPPRLLAAVAVLTLALGGRAAAQGYPANPTVPDPAGSPAGPAVMPAQAVGAAPVVAAPYAPGPVPGPAAYGAPGLPVDAVADPGGVWGPTCWVGAEYLLWWTRHGPNPQPLATAGPATGVGLLTAPTSQVVLGRDTFSFNSFSGV